MLDACLNICHIFGIWKYKHFDFPPKSTIDFIIGKNKVNLIFSIINIILQIFYLANRYICCRICAMQVRYSSIEKNLHNAEMQFFWQAQPRNDCIYLLFAEQTEILANKIVKEEEELAQLEKAMSLMKNSNNSYRATNCRNGDVKPTDKMIELENSMKNKVTSIKRFKRRLVEVHNDIEQVQYLVYKSVNDMAKMQAYVDGKKAETVQMEKELKEQDRKLFR